MAPAIAHLMVSIALHRGWSRPVAALPRPRGSTRLTPQRSPTARRPSTLAVMVGPVSVPAAVDRPEFVVQTAPNRVDVDEFNRWAAPLNDNIAQAVAGDLVRLLGTQNVAAAPIANFDPAYRVTIDVQRFESVAGSGGSVRGGVDGAQDGERQSGR